MVIGDVIVIRPKWANGSQPRLFQIGPSRVSMSEFAKNTRQDSVEGILWKETRERNVRSMTDLTSVINLR